MGMDRWFQKSSEGKAQPVREIERQLADYWVVLTFHLASIVPCGGTYLCQYSFGRGQMADLIQTWGFDGKE